jgi:hypothetical protein
MSTDTSGASPAFVNEPTTIAVPIAQHIAASWLAALHRAEIDHVNAGHASLLGWLLVLPPNIDPANAASAVLAQQQRLPQAVLSPELTELLQQVVVFSRPQLARIRRPRRRLH